MRYLIVVDHAYVLLLCTVKNCITYFLFDQKSCDTVSQASTYMWVLLWIKDIEPLTLYRYSDGRYTGIVYLSAAGLFVFKTNCKNYLQIFNGNYFYGICKILRIAQSHILNKYIYQQAKNINHTSSKCFTNNTIHNF